MSQVEPKKAACLLGPVCLYLFVILGGGILLALAQSLGITGTGHSPTLIHYVHAVRSPAFLRGLGFSFRTTMSSSVLSVAAGTALAVSLRLAKKKDRITETLLRIPVIVPHIVVVLMIGSLFAQTGILARILQPVFPGIGLLFTRIMTGRSGFGMVITYLWKEIPFVAMMVYAALVHVDDDLLATARNLGATRSQTVRYIVLPLAKPAILASFLIVFAYTFGAYEVPWLMGPTTPKALPVQAFIEYTHPIPGHRPYAMAYAVLLLLINGGLLAFFLAGWRKLQQRRDP
ncbi:MAG: ABC transporter permease [Peptoniphilaceae bacterium]|jgi:putative spermidine/putrescine transport system permease protein